MFRVERANCRTLGIPSVYISYHGHSLDHKTPLLRSVEALNKNAVAFLKLLGDVDDDRVAGLPLDDEAHHAVVARVRVAHDALVAVDPQVLHRHVFQLIAGLPVTGWASARRPPRPGAFRASLPPAVPRAPGGPASRTRSGTATGVGVPSLPTCTLTSCSFVQGRSGSYLKATVQRG